MRNGRVSRGIAAGLLCLGLAGGLSGCLYAAIPATAPPAQSSGGEDDAYAEDAVVVVFTLDSELLDEELLEAMLPIEQEALRAIEDGGLGYYDGNEIGGSEFALYFYGDDRDAMWALLEPIMRKAPLELARAELWPPGADAQPRIVEFGAG